MLLHNGRLANPLDQHTRAIAAVAGKTKKTMEELARLAQLEARGGMYETAEGALGLPVANVWRCLYNAAKAFKLGESVKQALIPTIEVVPLLIGGDAIACDDYIGADSERLFYVPVVIKRNRTMRARPKIPAGWEATVSMILLTDVLQAESLKPVIERAGRLVGLGDWRPLYGTFSATTEVS